MTSPLAGIKIIDLTRFIAGPFCTMLLADMGADVIKIEPPGGDDSRDAGADFLGGESALYISVNRNKRGLCMDIRKERGLRIFLELIKDADVLIENYRPGMTEKLKIEYNRLREINPRLTYCSLSAFGAEGPYRTRPGLDIVFQAMSGIMGISGEPNGRPMRPGFPVVDFSCGVMAAYGILLGLFQREKTGKGMKIDLSLLDHAILIQASIIGLYFARGKNPPRFGNASHYTLAQDFKTKDDKYICVSIANEKFWRKFCEVINIQELLTDPRFNPIKTRVENLSILTTILQEKFSEKNSHEWAHHLIKEGIPCSLVNTYEDVFCDPQVQYNKIILEIDHPTAGKVKVLRSPLKLNGNLMLGKKEHPPLLGEHNREILHELGYNDDKIRIFEREGIMKNGVKKKER